MALICNKNITAKLEKVNERALRFVFNEKQMSYCELLGKIGLPSLANQRLAKIVCTVFKAIDSHLAPRSIKELFGHRNSHYDLRGNDILKLPKANTTTYGLKSWSSWHQNYATQYLALLELFGLLKFLKTKLEN